MSTQEKTTAEEALSENPLSEREMDVARLLVTGATNSEIARELTISPNTVKVHLRNVFEKLQVASRTEAATLLLQRGWVTVPGLETAEADTETPAAAQPDAATSAPPEEAAPLADLAARPAFWQRIYVLIAIGCGILTLFSPRVFSFTQPELDMLSDSNAFTVGQPVVIMVQRWESRPPIGTPRSRLASAQIGDAIYIIGGESAGGNVVDTVEIFDLRFGNWRTTTPIPQPLANATAAAHDGRVYVAGGSFPTGGTQQDSISDILWVYDPLTEAWRNLTHLPTPLAGAAMVAASDALYLLGGWDGTAMRDEVWRLVPPTAPDDPAANWELVARLAVPRAFLGATAFNGRIYVAGGFDGQRELNLADVYDLQSGAWESLPPLTVARGGLSLISDGSAIFALGGGWTREIETHERFDLNAQLWSSFESPISGEWRHLAAASYQGSLHLIGGWGGDYLDTHLRYESSIRSFLLPLIRTD